MLEVWGALPHDDSLQAKVLLDRVVAVVTKLGQRGYSVKEDPIPCQTGGRDTVRDSEPDADST